MGAGSLLVAGSALAVEALFRVEQSWFNKPNPPVTPTGNAGKYQAYIQPYVTLTAMEADYLYPAKTAIVQAGNPIGGKFTLPQSAWSYSGTFTITSKTGWAGYTSITKSVYFAGPGHFKADNVHTNSDPSWIVFPTTNGNPYPNYALGNPNLPTVGGGLCADGEAPPFADPPGGCGTTTFDGLYDFARQGSINVTPGTRRFGGSLRVFYRPEAFMYQYVSYFLPAYYKGYGGFSSILNGDIVTPNSWVSEPGDYTGLYHFTRFLLNATGTGTGMAIQPNTAKATVPAIVSGPAPTYNGGLRGFGGTPNGGAASYVTGMQQYWNTIHPWTTGFASVHNPEGSPSVITPQAEGYDISAGGEDLTWTRTEWNQQFNKTLNTLTTTTANSQQYMFGVRRIVSMVRPRLIHTYSVPLDRSTDPITETWPVARIWQLKVFFVPEPAGMLLLGTGIVALLGVSRMRRR
jgi:hypothetical protein